MYETIDDFDINDELLDDIGTISNVKAVQSVVDRLEHITYSRESLGSQIDQEVDNLKEFVNDSKQALVQRVITHQNEVKKLLTNAPFRR